MTLDIKGFGRLTGYTANNPESTIGELNDLAATYSLTERSYKSQTYANAELITFSALSSDLGEISLNTELRNYLLKFIAFIDTSVSAKNFNNSVTSATTLITSNTSLFGDEFIISKVGSMVNSGSYYAPSFVEFKLVGGDLESTVIIWFSLGAFLQQYPLYTIYPITGIKTLDKLHESDENIKATLLTVNPTVMNNLEQAKIGSNPNTSVVSQNYKVYNDDGVELGVIYLSCVIYGVAGNNADVIRDTLTKYILDNSTYDKAAWELRIPDLFIKTEYVIVPRWDVTGNPNNGVDGAMYRSTVKAVDSLNKLAAFYTDASRSHIDSYGSISVGRYKSIMFASIGAPTNRNGIYSLDEQWPHYGNIDTTSEDYGRYDNNTKEFITRVVQMLKYAENIDDYVSLTEGYTKVTRNDNVYVSTTLNNIQYLVLTKKSMLNEE